MTAGIVRAEGEAVLAGAIRIVNAPRSMTRAQWRAFSGAYRAQWRRVQRQIDLALADLVVHGRAEVRL